MKRVWRAQTRLFEGAASLLSLLAVLCLISLTPQSVNAQSLQESWLQVQQGLDAEESTDLDVRITALEETASALHVLRLTPFSSALVSWVENHPDSPSASSVLSHAQKLDPRLPSAFFLAARRNWNEGAYFGSMGSYLAGMWNILRYEGSAGVVGASAAASMLLTIALSLVMIGLVQTLIYVRQLGHDAVELGGLLFQKGNAVVFAVVILFLPLFAGFGPVWLCAYLYAMTWTYMKRLPERILAIATLVILGCVPLGLEFWQGWALTPSSLSERVSRMVDERQVDFSTLREFADHESELGSNGRYNLILGELLRMHGHPERARSYFQKAAVAGTGSEPHVFLGSLALEDGNIQQAIQHYSAALEANSRSVLACLNLSVAFDQSNRFQEGDQMRQRAREIAGRRPGDSGLPGRDPRIRFPDLGRDTVQSLVSELPAEIRASVGPVSARLKIGQALTAPFSLAMWVNVLIGVVAIVTRRKMMWESSACTRCGKVFCPRCKTSTESMSYCSQCISVFLKRDLVSIEQQTAKMNQVRRWEAVSVISRRTIGVLLPGAYLVFGGNAVLGFVINLAVTTLLAAVMVWLPLFLPSADPLAQILPLQIFIGVLAVLLWMQAAVVAWYRR